MSDFNLVDEKWLTVTDSQCHPEEIPLADLFLQAHDYSAVDGDNGLQTVAILRLLLAISITLLYRYDENGELSELKSQMRRWSAGRTFIRKAVFPERQLRITSEGGMRGSGCLMKAIRFFRCPSPR